MKSAFLAVAAGLSAAVSLGGTAYATTYDTSLATPPGVYFGNGNSNQNFGWTVNTVNGVELGLAVVHRYIGNVTPNPTSTNNYYVPTGNDLAHGNSLAWWDFDFSVNVGSSNLLSQYHYNLSVANLGNGTSFSQDPLVYFPDSDGWSSGGKDAGGAATHQSTDYAFQNSENLDFINFSIGGLTFDHNANDTYLITLSLLNSDGASLGSVSENVIVGDGAVSTTPLPAALPMFASGLGFMGLFKWRRKRKKAPAAA